MRRKGIHNFQTAALLVSVGIAWFFQADISYGQGPCPPTASDMEGPYYVPNAPERSKTGTGLVVHGTVRSSGDCSVLRDARIEWWQVNPEGIYDDAHRATMRVGKDGSYRLETNFPVSYFRRPPHIHVKVFALGHETLTTQIYPKAHQIKISFEFVLIKE